jgi:PadR family transcriptional regulator PadR
LRIYIGYRYIERMALAELREPAFWILTVLARGRRHGYGVIDEARQLSDGRIDLRVATLYASLDRLVDDGLILADGDEIHDGRVRRYFRITEAGSERLRLEAERLAASAAAARASLAAATRRPAATQRVVFA